MNKRAYTVIGFYADNNQPWMAFVKSSSPKAAAKLGIKMVYDNGESGANLEDMFVVEVVEGQRHGELGNQKVVSLKDLIKKKE
jgi:hypothetical protein